MGLISGTSLNLFGKAQAGMGVAVGDYDAQWSFRHLCDELCRRHQHALSKPGEIVFSDVTAESGASRASRPNLGWGTGFADFDNDGWLDLFVANGHVYPEVDQLKEYQPIPAAQGTLPQPWQRALRRVSERVAGDLATPRPSRGAAFGDYDNDGDIDVLVDQRQFPAEPLPE